MANGTGIDAVPLQHLAVLPWAPRGQPVPKGAATATSEENRDRLHSRVRRPSLTGRREAGHRLATGVPFRAEMRLLLLGQKLHQLLDVSVQQVDRRDFAGMGSDPHDKILADSIDDEEAVIVTADREPTGMA